MSKPSQPIIIKKIKKAAHAHHGGAWKIAYADFVTAMMAFFLLMWLINMTTQEQKDGLAEYFAPTALSSGSSGAGGVLMGTAFDQSGNRTSAPHDAAMGPTWREDAGEHSGPGGPGGREESRSTAESQANQIAMATIRQAIESKPEIAELSRHIVIEETKDGVDVSLVDDDGRSMFPEGSVQPYERTRLALEALAPTLRQLPNRLAISGHTAAERPGAVPFAEPWGLSAGRALAVREILLGAGLPADNFFSVTGRADTEPVFPDNPYVVSNRRVTITLLNAEPPLPPNFFR